MAIETRAINGSVTEVYVVGKGGFITQSAPTNFHGFWKRKVLTDGESIDDYREVTAQEKAALERGDAQWEEPSADFVARCKSVGVVYNLKSGYFEGYGLTDITMAQMRDIMLYGLIRLPYCQSLHNNNVIRAAIAIDRCDIGVSLDYIFGNMRNIEVLVLQQNNNVIRISGVLYSFSSLPKLKAIYGRLDLSNVKTALYMFYGQMPALQTLYIEKLPVSINLQKCPSLSIESVSYMVTHASNTTAITITLHPEAYARLTDELSQWTALVETATEKNITFATA